MRTLTLLIVIVVCTMGATCSGPVPAQVNPGLISFDRGAFGLFVGKLTAPIAAACKAGKLSKEDCVLYKEVSSQLEKQILTPPPAGATTPAGIDFEQVFKLLGVFLGAAT